MVDIRDTQADLRLLPLSSSRFMFSTTGSAGSAIMSRSQFYLPNGGKDIRLLLLGAYAGAAEADFNAAIPATLSVAIAPAPFDPAKQYQPGDQVTYYPTTGGGGSYANNPYWTCAVACVGSPPKPSNANWSAGTRPKAVAVTFSGSRDGTLPTITLPSGTSITASQKLSDIIPLTVPVGGYLEIWHWINNSSGLYPDPPCNVQAMFPSRSRSAGQADITLGTTHASPAILSSTVHDPMIVGTPLVATPTCAIIGDSISAATIGTSGASAATVVNGGSGYAVGDILTISDTGATAGANSAGSQLKLIVDAVSSGVITTLRVISSGGYTNTTTQSGQTLPSGTQNLISLTGIGAGGTATVNFSSNSFDDGDIRGGMGFAQRGCLAEGVPVVTFASPGDRANLWASRSYSRLAVLSAACPTNAIVALGVNDWTTGDSADTILANLKAIATNVRAAGVKKVFVCTITPGTTSTSAAGQTTFADQATSGDSVRQAVNTALRAVPAEFDGCIDTAATVEGTGGDLGKWAPIGGKAAAADGKHPGPSAVLLMAAAVQAAVPQFAI